MPARLASSLRAYLIAFAAAAAAAVACWVIYPWTGTGGVLLTLPAAVALAAWIGGLGPALAAAVVGYLTWEGIFRLTVGMGEPLTTTQLMAYLVSSAIILSFGEARARKNAARGFDETERREAEEARAALAAIVATSDDAIVSKSLEGTIRSWNPGAERLFGYTAREAVGRPITLIVPPELRAEELAILERLRRGERVQPFETVRVTRSGRRIDISLTIAPIRNDAGEIVGASKIARDITQQKRAEAALRFSEERFRELANNIDQFAWTCDELGYATWYNQRWYDYTGATIEEMRGDGWKKFHDPAHVDRVVAGLQDSVATGQPWEDTFPLLGKDGEYRWFLSRAVPICNERGQVIRWFGTNTDITEQRQLEQELKAADQRKDEFLATLAHELRNPLAPMRNALEILNLAGDDPALIHEARSIIDRQVSHMVRLVDDLLDVSRITRDRLELRPAGVELNTLVQQTVDAHRCLADEQGLTLALVQSPEPMHLTADPVRLAQILSNLLNNAIRYTPRGGTVTVNVSAQDRDVVISVRDTGIGIPGDKLDDVFDMFTQVQGEQGHHGGLGIGLTLVRRLAELHGGTAKAHSEGLGKGSEFVVRLPVTRSAGAAVCPGGAILDAAPRRVLVVEDNPDTAATLETLLKLAGHQTRVAHDGPEALEVAEAFRPEVVLLDLGLPGLNGIEVCRWIRRQPWGERMKVVALTGWGQEADRRRTADAGFDEHLVKPVNPEDVLNLLAETQAA